MKKKSGCLINLLIAGIVVLLVGLVLSLVYLFAGSLEVDPTPEQQEKARITASILTIILGIAEACLVFAIIRIRRGRRNRTAEQ